MRAWAERYPEFADKFHIVAINELADAKTLTHLTRFDTTHGRFPCELSSTNETLTINFPNTQHSIALTHFEAIADIDWKLYDIDLVLECTGAFNDKATAERHLDKGAKRVMFSQPADRDVDATIVYGVNHHQLSSSHRIISNSSCTSNAIIPVIDAVQQSLGIESGVIRTLHSIMQDQPVIDAYHHTDLRKTRAAFNSMIPVDTELAFGIERFFPNMEQRFEAHAIRIPILNVSAIDIALQLESKTSLQQAHQILIDYCNQNPKIFGYTEEPLASCDFNHDPRSMIIDLNQSLLAGENLLKLMVWFDNEWGYANRMLDLTNHWYFELND